MRTTSAAHLALAQPSLSGGVSTTDEEAGDHDALQISVEAWFDFRLLQLRCIGTSTWPARLPPFAIALSWSAVNDIRWVSGNVVSMLSPQPHPARDP